MTAEEKQKKFLELFEPCRESLVRFVKAMTRNNDHSKDLVQETILRAFNKFEDLKNPVAFKSYLFSIASNIYKSYKWKQRFFIDWHSDEESFDALENMQSNGSETDFSYDVEMLWKAMQKLPDKQREAITLFEINGLSLEEVREIQGGSLSGVKSRIQRARKELVEMLVTKEISTNRPARIIRFENSVSINRKEQNKDGGLLYDSLRAR
ncbi:MAG: RNA polymerase sigma factor [Candidatus Kapabacteria bacterium]|nr:RNA polymerase sigma factor [Candidatus Kapabacteria bacterium]